MTDLVGKGITHPVVQEAYDNVPNDKRSDPRMHGRCAKAEALSKGGRKGNCYQYGRA